MQKRRYFWFSFVKLEWKLQLWFSTKWKLQLWFSTAYRVYLLFFIYALDFAKWKSENRFNFLIFNSKWKMKIRKLNLFSDFHFQIENEKWKSPSDFRFPFSNQKRKSELWNNTRTEQSARPPAAKALFFKGQLLTWARIFVLIFIIRNILGCLKRGHISLPDYVTCMKIYWEIKKKWQVLF